MIACPYTKIAVLASEIFVWLVEALQGAGQPSGRWARRSRSAPQPPPRLDGFRWTCDAVSAPWI